MMPFCNFWNHPRTMYTIKLCGVMCLKAVAIAFVPTIGSDDDEDNDDNYTVELPFSPTSTGADSSLLSRLDNSDVADDDNDYGPAGANEAANSSDNDYRPALVSVATNSNNNNITDSLRRPSYTDGGSKNKMRNSNDMLPLVRLPIIDSQKSVRDIAVVQSTSTLSWQSLIAGHEQLNHAVVSERRRLAAQKERLRKLRLVINHSVVI